MNRHLKRLCALLLAAVLCFADAVPAFASQDAVVSAAAITITAQPQDAVCSDGDVAAFTIGASGTGLTYQWQYSDNGVDWTTASAASATYKTNALANRHGRMVRCIVTDKNGAQTTSDTARLLVRGIIEITAQPQNISAKTATNVDFTVEAVGVGLTYQWQFSDDRGTTWKNGSAQTPTYTTGAKTARHGRMFRCVITDADGTEVISREATLYIKGIVKITAQPQDAVCADGSVAEFSVAAIGSSLTYCWQYSDNEGQTWTNGAKKSAVYSTNALTARHGRMFRCIITDADGTEIVSDTVRLLIDGVIKIKNQPQDVTAEAGSTATFSVAAAGVGLSYQWQFSDNGGVTWKNGTVTTAVYKTSAALARHGRQVRCVITDKDGRVMISSAATLKISGALKITAQPSDVLCNDGDVAAFTVTAAGEGLSYLWQFSDDGGETWKNGSSTSAKYSTSALTARHGRMFRCTVTDENGNEAVSDSAFLLINGVVDVVGQPKDVVAKADATAKFSVVAAGEELSYQWQFSDDGGATWKNGTVTTAAYSTKAAAARHGRLVRCVVTDKNGNVAISDAAALYIKGIVKITAQPQDVITLSGEVASFTVKAIGSSLSYRWQYSDDNGATWSTSSSTSVTYSTNVNSARHGRLVRCIVTDENGSEAVSDAARILIDGLIKIKTQPTDAIAKAGATAKFSVYAVGVGLTYQWQFSDDSGETWKNGSIKTASYSTKAAEERHGRMVRCVITDRSGNELISKPARILVSGLLKIVTQPTDAFCAKGDTVSFTVEAAGIDLTYKWQYSDDDGQTWSTSSASAAKYSTTAPAARHGRMIRCIVTDAAGTSVTSDTVRIVIESMLGITITQQPQDVLCSVGDTAALIVETDGIALHYQWQTSADSVVWKNTESTGSVYSFTVSEEMFSLKYRCKIWDDYGNECVTDTVVLKEEIVLITAHPQDWTGSESGKAFFEVAASSENCTYTWQISSNNGESWTTSSVTKSYYSTTATSAKNGWIYRCIVTDENGQQQISETAKLTISDEFEIILQPKSVSGELDSTAYFTIQAGGTDVVFEWQRSADGVDYTTIAENDARISQTVSPNTIGKYYRCIVTNSDGSSIISDVVRLTVSDSGFFTYSDKTFYAKEDGTLAQGFETVDGDLYRFSSGGVMQTGFMTIDGLMYYFAEDGKAAGGFARVASEYSTFYFGEDHAAVTGWQEIGGETYYFYETGAMALGVTQLGGNEYYFDPYTGEQKYGMFKVSLDDYMYFIEGEDLPYTGLKEIDGALYCFSSRDVDYGVTLSNLQTIDGKTYYFDPETKQAVTGLVTYNGSNYYFGDDHVMIADSLVTIDGNLYLFSVSGIMRYGLITYNGSRYYFDPETGAAVSGWFDMDGTLYYFDPETGAAVTGHNVIDGVNYHFGTTGHLNTGIIAVDGIRYYFAAPGEAHTGFIEINKNVYYVSEDATVATGLTTIDGELYYFDEYGVMKTGYRMIDDVRYYFDSETGKAVSGPVQLGNGNVYFFGGASGTLTGLAELDGELYYLNDNGIVQYGMETIDGNIYYFDPSSGKAVTGWQHVMGSDGVVRTAYLDPETHAAAIGLTEIDGKLYYFSQNGWALTGKQSDGEKTYCFSPGTYEAYTGWYRDTDGDYYFDGSNGRLVGPGVFEIDGANYYLGSAGKRQTGLKLVGDARMYFDPVTAQSVSGFVGLEDNGTAKIYYFDAGTDARYGLQTIDGNQFYFSDVGVMRYGMYTVDGAKCFFDRNIGIRRSGVVYNSSNDSYYLFDKDSATGVATAPVTIGGVLYAPYSSGTLRKGYYAASSSGLGYNVYFDDETGEQQFGLITYTNSSGTSYTRYFGKDSCLSDVTDISAELESALAANGWHTISGLDYYVRDGAMLTGMQTIDGTAYYFSTLTGAMLTGLRRIDTDHYYFDETTGAMKTGFVTIDGKLYRFDPETGKLCKGLTVVDGVSYYFTEEGAATGTAAVGTDVYDFGTNGAGTCISDDAKTPAPVQPELSGVWGTLNGAKCFYDMNGDLLTGLAAVDGGLYLFDENGKALTGLAAIDGASYYFGESGALSGQIEIDGSEYYFSPSSLEMLTGMQKIDGAFVFYNESGARQSGWVTMKSGEKYYMTDTGAQTGVAVIDSKTYFFGNDGIMRTGVQSITSSGRQITCLFGEDGAMRTGLVSDDLGLYFYDETTGARLTGFVEHDGAEYYFNPSSGRAVTGLRNINGMYCYFDPETAQRKYGLQTVNDKLYCFTDVAADSGLTYGLAEVDGKTYYFSESGGTARTGYHSINDVKYYFDPETGASVSGIYRTNNGSIYCFKEGGGINTGWVEQDGKSYFFYPTTGLMAEGLASVGDTLYYFDIDNGYLTNTTVTVGGIDYQLDENGAAAALGNSTVVKLINYGIENLVKGYGDEGGAEDASVFTCSQLVRNAFASIDINIIKGVYKQYYSLLNDHNGIEIDGLENAKAGDIIYYTIINCKYGESCDFWNELHHVGIYLGDGKLLESDQVDGDDYNDGVMVKDVYDSANVGIYSIVRLPGVN